MILSASQLTRAKLVFPTDHLPGIDKLNLSATKLQNNSHKELLMYACKTKCNKTKALLGTFYGIWPRN